MNSRMLWRMLLLMLASSAVVRAGLQVTESEFQLNLAAGQTGQYTFKVLNTGTQPQKYRVYLGDWYRLENGDNVFEEPGKVVGSCAKWLVVSPTEFEAAPGETHEVKFRLSVPPNETGTHWAIIFVEGAPRPAGIADTGQYTVGVQVRERIGIKIYQTVLGTEKPAGKVTKVTAVRAAGDKPWTALLEFQNTGTTHLRCKATFDVIAAESGQSVAKFETQEFPVLPGAKRTVSQLLETDSAKLGAGDYQVQGIVDFGGESLVAGRTKLTVP